ncbi:MAG: hypothetical protein U1E17_23420 [Geminicoccaceae bacterium]
MRSARASRSIRKLRSSAAAGLLAAALLLAPAVEAAGPLVIDGLAVVQTDGTLSINGTVVRLFGIYLPMRERTCQTVIRPPFCAARPVIVLNDKVQGFVRCEIVRRGRDGVLEGLCGQRTDDLFGPREDLGGYMVERGFALTTPDSPPEYVALERLAQSREVGLWGAKMLNQR